MKVALISGRNRRVGKTTLALMLANAYPNASLRESVYITNQTIDTALSYEKFVVTTTQIDKSINVLSALTTSGQVVGDDLMNYAYRPLDTSAAIFDAYATTIPYEEANEKLDDIIAGLGNRLIIMDVSGNPYDPAVSTLLDRCDAVLYVVTPDKEVMKEASEYYRSLSDAEKHKIKFIVNMFDGRSMDKGSIQSVMGIRVNSMIWYPYSYKVCKCVFEGNLCRVNALMLSGDSDCFPLRQPIKDTLSYVCDNKAVKVIKEVRDWK